MITPPRRMRELTTRRSLRLLGSVSLGRIAFTANAMPAIRPVNHILDGGDIIIRSHVGAAILTTHGQIVCYEADAFDPNTCLGWSVVVLGKARVIEDPSDAERYSHLVRPWVDQHMDYVIRLHPQTITGYEIVRGDNDAADESHHGDGQQARKT